MLLLVGNVEVTAFKALKNDYKGISAAQLALNLNENLPEKTITTVKENGNNIDVKVKQNKQTNWSQNKLENIDLHAPSGETVKLKDIARLNKTTTPSKLVQEDGDYATPLMDFILFSTLVTVLLIASVEDPLTVTSTELFPAPVPKS